jgi:prepilin-type processing-associated H-X9-DG protein
MDGYSETTPNGARYGFLGLPGARHDGGTTFSYADGRAEAHRWRDQRTTPPLVTGGQLVDTYASPRNPDIAWLQDRTTRPK